MTTLTPNVAPALSSPVLAYFVRQGWSGRLTVKSTSAALHRPQAAPDPWLSQLEQFAQRHGVHIDVRVNGETRALEITNVGDDEETILPGWAEDSQPAWDFTLEASAQGSVQDADDLLARFLAKAEARVGQRDAARQQAQDQTAPAPKNRRRSR